MRSIQSVIFFGRILSNSSFTFSIASVNSSIRKPRFGSDNVTHQTRRFSTRPIFHFGSLREPTDAITLFHKMVRTHPLPSVIDFTKLLTAVVRMKQYLVALHLFDQMLQRGAPIDHYTLNIPIDCYCRLKRADFGFAVLGSFFKSGIEPTVVTFNNLINGLLLVGKSLDAAKLLKRLLTDQLCKPDADFCIHKISRLCEPDMFSLMVKGSRKAYFYPYIPVIHGLCKDGMVDDALQLVSTMKDKGISPDVMICTSMIQGLCKLSRWNEVEHMLKIMVANKLCPNAFTCSILVDALCKEGRVETAEHILGTMKEVNVVCNALMNGYCLRGKMDEARRILKWAVKSGIKPNIISYTTLMNGYCKMGQVDEVSRLFYIEIPAEGLERDVVSYMIMLQALFREGRSEDGLKLFEEMEDLQLSPDIKTYNILLDGLCCARRIGDAFSVFHTIEVNGIKPDVVTYSTLIGALCKEGWIEKAKYLFTQMVNNGCLPNGMTYNVLVRGLLRKDDRHNALLLLQEMNSRGFTLDVTTCLMLERSRNSRCLG